MQLHYCYTYFTLWLLTVCWTVCVEELMPLGGNIDTELWGEEGSNYLFVYKTIDSIYCTVFLYMAFLILVVWNSVLIMMHSVHGLILCTCISFTVEIYVIFQRSCTLYILCEKLYCNFIYGINMQQLSNLCFIFTMWVVRKLLKQHKYFPL